MTTQTAVTEDGQVLTLNYVDEVHELMHKQLAGLIGQRNSLVAQANAASGDRQSLADSITETSDDAEIVQAREARDEAIMRLHSLVTPKVNEIMENAEGSKAETEEKVKELDKKVRTGLTYYKSLYTNEDFVKAMPSLVRVKGGAGTTGSGGRRIRGYEVEAEVDGEVTGFENFATLAKWLNVETTVLQDKFFEAAGNPKALKDAPDTVSFSLSFTDVDEDGNESENEAAVTATRTAKPKDEAADATDSDAGEDEDATDEVVDSI
jgi:hypothetical protein